VAGRGGPDRVGDDNGFGLHPGFAQFIGLRLVRKGIAARPHNELHFRVGHFRAVKVDCLSGVQEAFDKAGNRNNLGAFPVLVEVAGGFGAARDAA